MAGGLIEITFMAVCWGAHFFFREESLGPSVAFIWGVRGWDNMHLEMGFTAGWPMTRVGPKKKARQSLFSTDPHCDSLGFEVQTPLITLLTNSIVRMRA